MCDPISLIAMTAASGGIKAYSAYQQTKAARDGYNYNAKVNDLQAKDALNRGDENLQRHFMQASQLKGRQRAALAVNGVDLNYGSALDILTGTDLMTQYDASVIKQNAERESLGFKTEAGMNRWQAAQQKPKTAAFTSALTSAGQVSSQWYSFNKNVKGP